MILTKRVGLLAGGVVLTLTGVSRAETSVEAQNEELRARVAQLESRLATVEAQSKDGWLTEQRAAQIKGMVQDVLTDADARSSLQAHGTMTAGYDNGAVLGSSDGNWLLRTNLLLQERVMMRAQQNAPVGADETVLGAENTRTKFILSGHVVNPQWFYRVTIETAANDIGAVTSSGPDGVLGTVDDLFQPNSMGGGLDESYVGYDYGNGVKIMLGTMKAPLLFEELVQDQYQQAVERSLVNYIYTGGLTDGLAVQYANDMIRLTGMWSNGIPDGLYGGGVGGGVFGSGTGGGPALVSDTEVAATIRFEWLASGTWDQFKDYTSPKNDETGVLVGGAIHYQVAENDVPGIPDTDLTVLTLDASAELGGGNLYGAVIYANADLGSPGVGNIEPFAVVLGGGWYFTDNWELFGRYEWSNTDDLTIDDVSIATIGVNGYFASHNAKWTTDVGFGINQLDFAVPVTGWAIDRNDEEGQLLLRSQLQILF